MNFPFYIARRYLLAKKSHNAINIISLISVMGVTVGTMALVIILSVFNGFDELVRSLINAFNPDLKIELAEGKTFVPGDSLLQALKSQPGVYDIGLVLEDKALVKYDEQQTIAIVKGVSHNYAGITGIDSMMVDGAYILEARGEPYAVIGRGIRIFLNVMLLSPRQLVFYVPKRTGSFSMDASRALNRRYCSVAGVFSVEQDYDLNYVMVSLSFAQGLFECRPDELSTLEVKLQAGANEAKVQENLQQILGPAYKVLNRYQQNEVFYKTMKAEKWAIFLILFFILMVASFNVIGTLTMLMLEKKKDVSILSGLGADNKLLRKVFLYEGWLIAFSGAIAGTLLGLLVCWLQMRFGIIKLQGSGSFIIDAYPVVVKAGDVLLTLVAVVIIGFFAAWYPVRFLSRLTNTGLETTY